MRACMSLCVCLFLFTNKLPYNAVAGMLLYSNDVIIVHVSSTLLCCLCRPSLVPILDLDILKKRYSYKVSASINYYCTLCVFASLGGKRKIIKETCRTL